MAQKETYKMDIMKNFENKFASISVNDMENYKSSCVSSHMNLIFSYLSKGMIYKDIVDKCPELSEDDINAILWYFAKKGIRYIPSLS